MRVSGRYMRPPLKHEASMPIGGRPLRETASQQCDDGLNVIPLDLAALDPALSVRVLGGANPDSVMACSRIESSMACGGEHGHKDRETIVGGFRAASEKPRSIITIQSRTVWAISLPGDSTGSHGKMSRALPLKGYSFWRNCSYLRPSTAGTGSRWRQESRYQSEAAPEPSRCRELHSCRACTSE